MPAKRRVLLEHRRDGRWAIKRNGNKRALSVHETRREAEAKARALAQRDKTEFIEKGLGWEIRRREVYGDNP